MFLIHRRDVIEPVEIADRLQIGLVLDQLLGAAMQKADMRIDALDDLTVELEHQAQHAMRGRMLRAEIERDRIVVLGNRLGDQAFFPVSPDVAFGAIVAFLVAGGRM